MNLEAEQTTAVAEAGQVLQQVAEHLLLGRCLAVAAESGIADLLAEGPRTADELARMTGMHGETLLRMLALLASHGFFVRQGGEHFALNARAATLRADVPGSLRDRLRLPLQDLLWRTYEKLPEMIRTGQPAFECAFGASLFHYLSEHAALNEIFDRAMACVSQDEDAAIAALCPVPPGARITDVGGGRGGLLAAILERHPTTTGVLFDQPQVVYSPAALQVPHLVGRWQCVGGDFFAAVPPGSDLYLLKRVVHDWDDARAVLILRNCRLAMTGANRLLIIEALLGSGCAPDPVVAMDVNIMALTGGRERSAAQFRALCRSAGLEVAHIVTTGRPGMPALIEARPI